MRNTVILTIVLALAFTLVPVSISAQNYKTPKSEQKKKEAFDAYIQKDYGKAADLWTEQIKALKEECSDCDSDYVNSLIQLGKCQFRNSKTELAVATLKKAACIFGEKFGKDKETYAIILDNMAFYLNVLEKYSEAAVKVDTAIQIYSSLPDKAVSYDFAAVLEHAAEANFYIKDYAKATTYEIRALNLLKQIYGEHSQEYLDELPYLQKYFEASGSEAKAKQIEAKLERLTKEFKDGVVDLPDFAEIKTAEDARKHRYDMLRFSKYYLDRGIVTGAQGAGIVKFLLQWSTATDEVTITIGKNEAELVNDEKSTPYFFAYVAACCKYGLESRERYLTRDSFQQIMVDVLNFYYRNRKYTGKIKYLEKYIKAYEKDKDSLSLLLDKNYPEPDGK